jgi:hypothetical protein
MRFSPDFGDHIMMSRFISAVILLSIALSTAPAHADDAKMTVGRWEFNVYLNNKRIGKHLFEVTNVDGQQQVQSTANFKYTILRIPAYRYEHTNQERWSNDCLLGIDASTNANGNRIEVSGQKTGSTFVLAGEAGDVSLPECVMTFAYWNPAFLEQVRLLNPQTGEYVEVRIEEMASEMLEVRGKKVAATRFRLTADKVDMTLWYSGDKEWLALESVAKGGRIIRYELS